MLTTISLRFAQWLVANGSDPDDEEIFAYGIECFLSIFLTFGSLILIAILMGNFLSMILWLACWLPLRSFLGGYHASTHWRCYWGSIAVVIVNMLIYPYLPISWIPIILITATFVVFKIAPVTHPNHPLSIEKKQRMKVYARISILIEALVVFSLYTLFPLWSKVAVCSIITAVILAIISKIRPLSD